MHHNDHPTPSVEAVDPVCGMTVTPARAAATREVDGVDGVAYYFCSAQCAATFDADLDRYASSATGNE